MFESIVSKISNVVRYTVRAAAAAATRRSPWLGPVAIVAIFLIFCRPLPRRLDALAERDATDPSGEPR